MKLTANLCTLASLSSVAILALVVLGLFAIGCANPGPPRPPSLHLPQIVTDLTAERRGDEIHLHWTTPAKTTDDLKVSGTVTAELCRISVPSQLPVLPQGKTSPQPCLPVHTQTVQPGPSDATDQLPTILRSDPQGVVQYQVRLLNAQHHTAGFSTPALVAAGSAPPLVSGLHIQATAQGALLQWEPQDAADSIELDRLHTPKAATPDPASKTLAKAPKEPAEIHLRAATTQAAPFRTDAGGTMDSTAHRGETYVYTAQRVRKIVLDGHPLEIRSAPSQPVSVTMRDAFPPKPPTGLETITAGQDGVSPAVDLSWRPNIEPDLAGYLLYRQELSAAGEPVGTRIKLTSMPIQEPGFHDAAVLAGHYYSYSVTAVDASGNESTPGKSAREDLPQP